MFQVLSQLSENFIFIYLGVNLFTQEDTMFKPLFIFLTTVSTVNRTHQPALALTSYVTADIHLRCSVLCRGSTIGSCQCGM